MESSSSCSCDIQNVNTIHLESDVLNCPICLEQYKKPKYLPCLHTFCESCLSTYIISTQSENETQTGFFLCPVCRQEVKAPDPNSPKEEWVKSLPLNHLIFALMGQPSIGTNKEETMCGPCQKDEETTQAKFWCVECYESMCENCRKFHNRFVSSSHNIIPIEQAKCRQMKIPDIDEPCLSHKGEILKVYCNDHMKMCCVICLAVNHRQCKDIKTFDEMAMKLKNDDGIVNLGKKLKGIGEKFQTLSNSNQENIDEVDKQQQDLSDQVSMLVEEAKDKLNKCFEDFKTKLSQTYKMERTKLIDIKERLENIQKTLSNDEKMLQTATDHGSSKQQFMTSEKVRVQLEIQEKELKAYLKEKQKVKFEVTINDHLKNLTSSMLSVAELIVQILPSNDYSITKTNDVSSLPNTEDSTGKDSTQRHPMSLGEFCGQKSQVEPLQHRNQQPAPQKAIQVPSYSQKPEAKKINLLQNRPSSKTSTVDHDVFGDLLKPPSGPWSCGKCMIQNKKMSQKCEMCGTPKPETKILKEDGQSSKSSTVNFFQDQELLKPKTEAWRCGTCRVKNNKTSVKCGFCGTRKPAISFDIIYK